VPGVDLAHPVRVWRDVRAERGANVAHEGQGGLWRGPQAQHLGAISPEGLRKPCRCPQGATNIEPGGASCGSPSPRTSSRPLSTQIASSNPSCACGIGPAK
jgi:hypothetical protein